MDIIYLLGSGGDGRDLSGVDHPDGVRGRASDRVGGRGGTTVTSGGGVLGESALEVGVLIKLGDGAAADLDDTVLVGLLGVLVHETTRVDTGHLGVHESLHLVEGTGVGVATVLRQAVSLVSLKKVDRAYSCCLQNGDTVVGEVLNLDVPSRLLEAGAAPGVVVEGEEVGAGIIATAVEVLGGLHAVVGDIGGRVADGDVAKAAGGHVVLDVTGDSLDIGGSQGGVGLIVDDLVSGEEGEGVVVLGKLLDGGEDALEVDGVVRRVGVGAVDGVLGVVDIGNEVDASVGELLHALLVVLGVIDGVDTDGVHTEVLELGNVTTADGGIGQGVDVLGRATGLVVDTTDVEAGAISVESYSSPYQSIGSE